MRFLVEKISALLCFLDGFGITVPVFRYLLETSNSVIICIITVPDCGLPNDAKLSNFMNYCKCSAHFSKGKMLYFPLKFCVFQYTNSTCIHNKIVRVCIIISSLNLCHNEENDTKHDRFCKSVTEIKDHAKNFPNAPRIYLSCMFFYFYIYVNFESGTE